MSALAKAIRQKRFTVREDAGVKLVIDTRTGARVEFLLGNCSIHGLGTLPLAEVGAELGLETGELVPAAKLEFGGQEVFLGRLTVRNVMARENGVTLGFATVDAKVPVDGLLSRFLTVEGDRQMDPYAFELSPDQFSLANFVQDADTNADLFARCRKFEIFHREWEKSDKHLYNEVRESSMGARVNLKVRRKDGRNDYIQMAAYDYLNLGTHPKVLEAADKANRKFGYCSGGSPTVAGTTELHEELAERLARQLHKEAVVLFNSGYAANIGTLAGLMTNQDLIVADMLSHASLHDGIGMSRANARFYKHNNMNHLEKILEEHRPQASGALIVTEGVFSMDGDAGDIKTITELARKYNARVLVDEAHSFGLYGRERNGISEVTHKMDQVDIYMSSLSKVCGAGGGFIAARQEVVDWLKCFGRARLFSGSMPASSAAVAIESLNLIQSERERVDKLLANVKHFVRGLRDLGAPIAADHNSPIVPLVIGDEKKLGQILASLMDAGVYVVPIIYPAVSRTQCRFRFSLQHDHSITDLDFVCATLKYAMKEAGFDFSQAAAKMKTAG